MKVIGGIHSPDSGKLAFEGQAVSIDSVNRASDLGIAFIHQELNLSDNLSIGANVFLGREPRKGGVLGRRSRGAPTGAGAPVIAARLPHCGRTEPSRPGGAAPAGQRIKPTSY